MEKVFAFIITRTRMGLGDLQNLSSEGKRRRVEYVIIGLISGSIKVKELTIDAEYTKHKRNYW